MCIATGSQSAKAQGGYVGSCQAAFQSQLIRSAAPTDTMQEVRGVSAHGVWRMSLLQGHEEVWGARAHEAVVHHATVHRGESNRAIKDTHIT